MGISNESIKHITWRAPLIGIHRKLHGTSEGSFWISKKETDNKSPDKAKTSTAVVDMVEGNSMHKGDFEPHE